MSALYGKHRGKVVQNVDPLSRGRLIAIVPSVSEIPLSWAMPCTPYAGDGLGFFAIPPIGANVWIEFEAGDINLPVWSGCFWGKGDTPATPSIPTTKVLRTDSLVLTVDDLTRTTTLEVSTGAGVFQITFDDAGLTLSSAGAHITVGPREIELESGESKGVFAPDGVLLENGAKLEIKSAAGQLANGAKRVNVSSQSVSINDGALEVT